VTIINTPGVQGKATLILQQEWAQVGIKLDIVPSTNNVVDFLQHHRTDLGVFAQQKPGIGAVTETYNAPQSLADVCGYNNPALDPINAALEEATPGSTQAVQAWQQAQDFVIKNALADYIAFVPVLVAWNSHRVGGIQPYTPFTDTVIDWYTAYVKA
jgi:ABC-type transport system substrate-binding protein